MILFVNVFITDKAILMYDRGRYGRKTNRADIFKYTLASYAAIPWSKVFIYYQLDDNYAQRYQEINSWIADLFPEAVVNNYRNDRQPMWQDALSEVFAEDGEELVWFTCNDDHVFTDSSLDFLQSTEQHLLELTKRYERVGCPFTHWSDFIGAREWHEKDESSPYQTQMLEQNELGFVVEWRNFGSVQIVNQELLRYWFFENDYGDAWIPRTDGPGRCVISPKFAGFVPGREIGRHFDGYSHVGIDLRACPPLEIPPGFFQKDIRIDYLADAPLDNRVLVNPLLPDYRAVSPCGADLRMVIEELPLFWQSRISEIKVHKEVDRGKLLGAHNQAVLELASAQPEVSADSISDLLDPALRTEGRKDVFPDAARLKKPAAPLERVIQKNWRDAAPLVSVIIFDPLNARGDLRTVDSLCRQTLPRDSYEIIWAAPSNWVAFSSMPRVDTVISGNRNRELACGTYQKHISYNLGLREARGRYIVLADSEQVFPENFLASVIETFNDDRIGLLAYHESFEGAKIRQDACLVIRRDHAIRIGGFDESLFHLGRRGGGEEFRARYALSGLGLDASYDESVVVLRFAGEHLAHTDLSTEISVTGVLPTLENRDIHRLRTGHELLQEAGENHLLLQRELANGLTEVSELMSCGNLNGAESLFEDLSIEFPNNLLVLTGRAALETIKGNLDLSAQLLRLAETTVPGNIGYYCSTIGEPRNGYAEYAEIAALLGYQDLALFAFERATQLMPDRTEYFSRYGSFLVSSGRPELAAEQFKRALALDKTNGVASAALGVLTLLDNGLDKHSVL